MFFANSDFQRFYPRLEVDKAIKNPIDKSLFYGDYFNILSRQERHTAIYGGRGSLKTTSIILYLLYCSYLPEYADKTFLLVRRHKEGIERTMGANFIEVLALIKAKTGIDISKDFKFRGNILSENVRNKVKFNYTGLDKMVDSIKSTPSIAITFYDESGYMLPKQIDVVNETMRFQDAQTNPSIIKSFYAWNPVRNLAIHEYIETLQAQGLGSMHKINYNTFSEKGANESIYHNAQNAIKRGQKFYEEEYLGIISYDDSTFKRIQITKEKPEYGKNTTYFVGVDPVIHQPKSTSDYLGVACLAVTNNGAEKGYSYDAWGMCFRMTFQDFIKIDLKALLKIPKEPRIVMVEKNIIGEVFKGKLGKNWVTIMAGKESKAARIERFLGLEESPIKLIRPLSNTAFLQSVLEYKSTDGLMKKYDDGIDALAYACYAFNYYLKR